MTRSELILALKARFPQLDIRDTELAVNLILDAIAKALQSGDRTEIRGFGAFMLHYRQPRIARNPKTGEAVTVLGKYSPRFKPGKYLQALPVQAMPNATSSCTDSVVNKYVPVVPIPNHLFNSGVVDVV